MSLTNSPSWAYNPSTGFYNDVATQSLRLNQASSSYLSDTLGTPTDRRKFTISMWIKRSRISYNFAPLFGTNVSGSLAVRFRDNDVLEAVSYVGGFQVEMKTTRKFRDTSSWYHMVFIMDIDNNTGADRFKLYVNGERTTWSGPANVTVHDPRWNFAAEHYIGKDNDGGGTYFDGYMADINFVDGQALLPTSFGEEKNGIWIPKTYSGSYGNNGFYLKLAGNGNDSSGNSLNFTTFNIGTHDYVADCPENNWCTLNTIEGTFDVTYSEGALRTQQGGTYRTVVGTMFVSSGKWYFEHYNHGELGIVRVGNPNVSVSTSTRGYNAAERFGVQGGEYAYNWYDGVKINNNSSQSYGATFADGDITACALDLDAGTVTFYKNNSSQGVAYSSLPAGKYAFAIGHNNATEIVNFGQDSTFAGNKTSGSANATDANGFGDFYYTPPSGHLAMCSANLPDPDGVDPNADESPTDYFSNVLWTGNGSAGRSITGVGFQPDWVWMKARTGGWNHFLFDMVRGANKYLISSSTQNEASSGAGNEILSSFDSDGFSLATSSNNGNSNNNGSTYVSWNWKASNSTSSNTNGSITSTVNANPDIGFSIVSYVGNGISGATIGHGLSQAPEMIITKHRSGNGSNFLWPVYHRDVGTGGYLRLQAMDGITGNSQTVRSVSSTTWEVGSDGHSNRASGNMIAYVFHSVDGFSAFGSHRGNGNSDGTFIYTGFRPAFVLFKEMNNSNHWFLQDSKRPSDQNPVDSNLYANLSNNEVTNTPTGGLVVDFVSNGIKIRGSGSEHNRNNGNYMYMAFAEQPFKYANAK